jgi:hypothetical protein
MAAIDGQVEPEVKFKFGEAKAELKSSVAKTSAFRRPKPLSGPVRGKIEAKLCNRLN